MISLELFEKTFWTSYDFVVKGPKEFYALKKRDKNRYVSPIIFYAVWFILMQISFLAFSKFLAQEKLSHLVEKQPLLTSGAETSIFYSAAANALGSVFAFVGVLFWFKAAIFLVRKKATFKQIAISLCYSQAANLYTIIFLGFIYYYIFILESNIGQYINKIINIGAFPLTIVVLYYLLSSTSCATHISKKRLLLGVVLALVGFVTIIITGIRLYFKINA